MMILCFLQYALIYLGSVKCSSLIPTWNEVNTRNNAMMDTKSNREAVPGGVYNNSSDIIRVEVQNTCCLRGDIEKFHRLKRVSPKDQVQIAEHRKSLDAIFKEQNKILYDSLVGKIQEVKFKFKQLIDAVFLKTETKIAQAILVCFQNVKNGLLKFDHRTKSIDNEYLEKLFEGNIDSNYRKKTLDVLTKRLAPSDEIFKLNISTLADICHSDLLKNVIEKYKTDTQTFINKLEHLFTLHQAAGYEDEEAFEQAEYVVNLPDAYQYTNMYIRGVESFETQVHSEIKIHITSIADAISDNEGINTDRILGLTKDSMDNFFKMAKNELLLSTSEILSFFKNSFDAYLFVIFNSINDVYVYFDDEIKSWHKKLTQRLKDHQ